MLPSSADLHCLVLIPEGFQFYLSDKIKMSGAISADTENRAEPAVGGSWAGLGGNLKLTNDEETFL